MKLNKYSQAKEAQTVIGAFSPSSSSSSPSSPSTSLSRDLWGQPDTGDDIDGSMVVNGNIYAGAVNYDEDASDDDTPENDFNHEFPSEDGNIFAENTIIAGKELQAPQTYGKDLFLDYKNKKTNVLDLIGIIKEEVLEEVRNTLDNNKYGSASHPVILMAGTLVRSGDTADTRKWSFKGSLLPCFRMVNIMVSGGALGITLSLTVGTKSYLPTAIMAMQASSGITDAPKNQYISEYPGAYWFEGRWYNNMILLHEFHKDDLRAATWSSTDWNGDNSLTSVNIIVCGYVSF